MDTSSAPTSSEPSPTGPPSRASETPDASTPRDRHPLSRVLTAERVAAHLPEPGAWRPVPRAADRTFWDGVDDVTRSAVVASAESYAAADWPVLTARLWRDYVATGNRVRYQDPYFTRRRRLVAAVLAACVTDDDRWHDEALDGIWLILEETSWCIPAHDFSGRGADTRLPDPAHPALDLFAAETGALLAWASYVLAEALDARSPLVRPRIRAEVLHRILVPQRTDDSWVWFGRHTDRVNNWNPWINANVLTCSLLLDDDRDAMVTTALRALEGLDTFVAGYPDDGGCDEGQMYWWRAGASLSECLEILRSASGGALDAFGVPVLRQIARYPHQVHVADGWYVNVADGPARLDGDALEPHVLYRFGRRVDDDEVVDHARFLRGSGPVTAPTLSIGRSLLALVDADWRSLPEAAPPLVGTAWLPETQLLTARQHAGRVDGLFVSLKGGHNGESHNHNDVGTVYVAVDGHPALVDAGVAEYTRQHFGPRRYEIWTMRSTYHNVPYVDGVEQAPGEEHAARDVDAAIADDQVRVAMDLAGAYPAAAGLHRWRRQLTLDRAAGEAVLTDAWEFDHDPTSVVVHLVAAAEPVTELAGAIVVPTPAPLRIGYESAAWDVGVEEIPLEDRRLSGVWGPTLWRIAVRLRTPERSGSATLRMTRG